MSHPQDFPNAQLPSMLPLARSYAENQIEEELKQLFIDLFASMLAQDTFNVSVLGAAHLGSFDLVRRAVNADGLVLLQGDREEAATRYLYRAWKSGNTQGRGLHFLRTYLQLLFPNLCRVEQLWQEKAAIYPTSLHINNTEENTRYLTSRVRITIDASNLEITSVSEILSVIRSIIPARLVPEVRLVAVINANIDFSQIINIGSDIHVDNFIESIIVINQESFTLG